MFISSEQNEIMLKKIAFWHVAITATLLVIVLAGGSITLYAVVVVLIGIGWFILKNIQSDLRATIATISLTAVIFAGLVIPTTMNELARGLDLRGQFVLAWTALGVVMIIGSSMELIRRMKTGKRVTLSKNRSY